jgi:hypothetical protein
MKYRSINMALVGAASLVVCTMLLQGANAQSAPSTAPAGEGPTLRVACGQDMQSLCPGLAKKEARQCLRAHRAQLSAACSAFFQEARARRATGSKGSPAAVGPATGGPPDADQRENK